MTSRPNVKWVHSDIVRIPVFLLPRSTSTTQARRPDHAAHTNLTPRRLHLPHTRSSPAARLLHKPRVHQRVFVRDLHGQADAGRIHAATRERLALFVRAAGKHSNRYVAPFGVALEPLRRLHLLASPTSLTSPPCHSTSALPSTCAPTQAPATTAPRPCVSLSMLTGRHRYSHSG